MKQALLLAHQGKVRFRFTFEIHLLEVFSNMMALKNLALSK